MKPYPLKLSPVLKDAIWGGNKLITDYDKKTDALRVAESWDLTVRKLENNRIENGEFSGKTLKEYLEASGEAADHFPLLVKWIDARDKLSIQVHPCKTEMWYIVSAEPGASIVYDSQGNDPALLRSAIENGTLESLLTAVEVHPGECYFIPSGLVHAIGAGIVIAEIQQNSDITYRLYDYQRKQADGSLRQLHVSEGLGCIRAYSPAMLEALQYESEEKKPGLLSCCPFFRVEKQEISDRLTLSAAPHFRHVMILSGEGTLGELPYRQGNSFFLPAGCEAVALEAKERTEVLISTVPKSHICYR